MNFVHRGRTLPETKEVEHLSNPYEKKFLICLTIVGALVLIIYFTRYFDALRIPLAYVLPLALLVDRCVWRLFGTRLRQTIYLYRP